MTDKSIDQHRQQGQQLAESLSALVDDQASDMELRRLLKQSDAKLEEQWSRYHMIGAAMRGESVTASGSLLPGVQEALAEEAPHSAKPAGFWAGAGRFAIAASVACVVVLGVQQNWQQFAEPVGETAVAEAQASPVISQPTLVEQPVLAAGVNSPLPRSQNPAIVNRSPNFLMPSQLSGQQAAQKALTEEQLQRRLNILMMEHANNAAANSGRGVLPYARVPKIEQ
ncbi:sigma-E factor negative regulatory protein [uncultured Pseudoteredinibacter sp.]|uniref:sigma-E factor negative regulatory protein n=1 Tax=uncultured Pseudoteredinibacter sp. TaxID=1641701 RepID=UPI0026344EE2|nr:sigma-E factor negative regulatory protein [uncultured Pseudoteredinibacter sp.]